MPHLVLLGDSLLDNGRYTNGGPEVVSQVRVIGSREAAQRAMIFA